MSDWTASWPGAARPSRPSWRQPLAASPSGPARTGPPCGWPWTSSRPRCPARSARTSRHSRHWGSSPRRCCTSAPTDRLACPSSSAAWPAGSRQAASQHPRHGSRSSWVCPSPHGSRSASGSLHGGVFDAQLAELQRLAGPGAAAGIDAVAIDGLAVLPDDVLGEAVGRWPDGRACPIVLSWDLMAIPDDRLTLIGSAPVGGRRERRRGLREAPPPAAKIACRGVRKVYPRAERE